MINEKFDQHSNRHIKQNNFFFHIYKHDIASTKLHTRIRNSQNTIKPIETRRSSNVHIPFRVHTIWTKLNSNRTTKCLFREKKLAKGTWVGNRRKPFFSALSKCPRIFPRSRQGSQHQVGFWPFADNVAECFSDGFEKKATSKGRNTFKRLTFGRQRNWITLCDLPFSHFFNVVVICEDLKILWDSYGFIDSMN